MGTKSAWTEERRRRQSEIICKTKPWEHSTGPRTEEGKNVSSRNATSLWVARRKALEAVSKNLLDQIRLYTEVLGLNEGELYANRDREIDFKMATEDQQDRYVNLIWDEIELKAELFALWPADVNCQDFYSLDGLDWRNLNDELGTDCDFDPRTINGQNNDNDNERCTGQGSVHFPGA